MASVILPTAETFIQRYLKLKSYVSESEHNIISVLMIMGRSHTKRD